MITANKFEDDVAVEGQQEHGNEQFLDASRNEQQDLDLDEGLEEGDDLMNGDDVFEESAKQWFWTHLELQNVKMALFCVFLALVVVILTISDHRSPNSNEANNGQSGTDLDKKQWEEMERDLAMMKELLEAEKALRTEIQKKLRDVLLEKTQQPMEWKANAKMDFGNAHLTIGIGLFGIFLINIAAVWWFFARELAKQTELQSDKIKLQCELASIRKILPLNQWSSVECPPDLAIIGESLLVVERREQTEEHMVCIRAKLMMPKHQELFYYEVKIIKRGMPTSRLWVGLGRFRERDSETVGIYTYDSGGEFWGHRVDGCVFYDEDEDEMYPCLKGKSTYGVGDVIGCGVNLATRQIIYTKNGRRLNTANLFVYGSNLYPFIGLEKIGDKVEANFGQKPFAYDLSKELGYGLICLMDLPN